MPRQIHAPARLLVTAILLAALFHAHPVRAEARVSGAPDAVLVEARDAAVDEVMAALGASFGLQYHSPASLSRRVTGTYQGSLQRVVARLLDGYDFVIKTGDEGVAVRVYGAVKAGEAGESVLAPKPVQVAKPPPAAKARREARRKRQAP
jgi:hypothetical protein